VATILLAGVDPFFGGKLSELLSRHRLVTTESIDEPDLVIVDISRVDPVEITESFPVTPVLGYASHSDPAGERACLMAGFDRVVDRSALIEAAETLVSELTAPVE